METKFVYYSLDRARNGEHFDFINTFLNTLTFDNGVSLGIADYRATLDEAFATEDAALKQIQSYNDTKDINALDAERDELFRFLTQEVKNQQRNPVAARKTAALALEPLLKTYANSADKTQRDETGLLTNFVADLEGETYAKHVTALALTDVVAALKTANTAFEKAFLLRVDEKEYRNASDSVKVTRPRVDAAYQAVITMLNSLYNVYTLSPMDFSEKLGLLVKLAPALNANANDLKRAIDIREAGSGKPHPVV